MATPLYELRRLLRERLLEPYALATPGAPNVSPQGTPGATTVGYCVVARNATGSSIASQTKTIATSAATLTGTNYNQVTWTPVLGATIYDVYRPDAPTSPATTGLIGSTTGLSFDDTGVVGDGEAAPTVNTSGTTDPFWDDTELLNHLRAGCHDLWRAAIDLHRNHFATEDATNMSVVAGATSVTGVPSDCFRILMIEPRDITSAGSYRNVVFRPKPFQSGAWQAKRAIGSAQPGETEFYYDLINAGSPVAAPIIKIVPAPTSTLLLRVLYVNTLPTLDEDDNNPIPGESDNAVIAWGVAYARAKERDDRMPDPAWLSIYATDKQALLTAMTPRQEQEPEVVEDLW